MTLSPDLHGKEGTGAPNPSNLAPLTLICPGTSVPCNPNIVLFVRAGALTISLSLSGKINEVVRSCETLSNNPGPRMASRQTVVHTWIYHGDGTFTNVIVMRYDSLSLEKSRDDQAVVRASQFHGHIFVIVVIAINVWM